MNNHMLDIGWNRMLKWCVQFTRALVRLHNAVPQILHRDFKSLNLLVARDWTLRMADFGLSRFNVKDSLETLSHTVGTATHMAPEVFPNEDGSIQPYTDRGDIYSAGIVFWELATRCVSGAYAKPWFSENLVPVGPQSLASIYCLQ
jgi:serine/threonine protein kinase